MYIILIEKKTWNNGYQGRFGQSGGFYSKSWTLEEIENKDEWITRCGQLTADGVIFKAGTFTEAKFRVTIESDM
jgi:hypothetical protein